MHIHFYRADVPTELAGKTGAGDPSVQSKSLRSGEYRPSDDRAAARYIYFQFDKSSRSCVLCFCGKFSGFPMNDEEPWQCCPVKLETNLSSCLRMKLQNLFFLR